MPKTRSRRNKSRSRRSRSRSRSLTTLGSSRNHQHQHKHHFATVLATRPRQNKFTKKYMLRPSPNLKAQHYKDEKRMGNDGHFYVSTRNKNGIYTWKRL